MNEYLESLEKEYQSIPIPEDLEFRVRASMERAKQEQREEKRPGRVLYRALKRTGVTAAAAVLGLVVLTNASPTVAYAMEQVPVLGAITRVFTFRTYEDDRGNVSAHVDVPQVEGNDALNDVIQQYVDTIINQYEKDAALQGAEGHYDLDLTYTIATDSDSLFALRFNQTQIMASGVESARIYAVDKGTGRILTLADLFQTDSGYQQILTRMIQEQMARQMEEDPAVYYWLNDEVEAWNITQLPPDTDFYVNEAGDLVLVFDEGEVAPMYMGLVEFTIPAEDLKDIAQGGYLGGG